MKTEKMTINENGKIRIQDDVFMSPVEIAALFEVYVQTVNANIKAVLKSGAVKATTSCTAVVSGKTITPYMFGLDMIIAIAFRLDSPKANVFRKWVVHQLTENAKPPSTRLFVQLSRKITLN